MPIARRAAVGLVLVATIAGLAGPRRVAAGDPDAPHAFWTPEELALIDRGLEAVNADRRDLGFQKRPIDDPFRLAVVDRALDDPLSIGVEAQAWDDAARGGDVLALLDRAGAALGQRPKAEATPDRPPALPLEAPTLEAALPPGARVPLRELLGAIATARREVATAVGALGADRAWWLARAARSQRGEESGASSEADDARFLALARQLDVARLLAVGRETVARTKALVAVLRAAEPGAFDARRDSLREQTSAGTVVLSGVGDDVHGDRDDPNEGDDVVLVIDLGGDDVWRRGASASDARPVSVCIDLAGDDRYVGRRDLSFGGALGGVAIQWDAAGDDLYDAGHLSLGAAIAGVGVLVDAGGDDVQRGRDFCLGAGAFGVGVLLDVAGNDLRHADLYGEGFASTLGCGVLADLAGHDVYDAGGVHSDAPLHRDRTQSLSQGFAIGMRPSASGGVGVLVDVAGNDRYAADVYGQGASYWFSLGLLIDDEGNDAYVLGHYGQGAGIHLSAGMLFDRAGQDLYFTEYGVGIGGAHDYAVGLLLDRGGDDHYVGSGGSQGGALTNSVAILLDGGGADEYTAARPGASHGAATPARETGGIGLLLDAGGADVYSEPTKDGGAWTSGVHGAGLDEPTPTLGPPAPDPMGAEISLEAATARVDAEGTVAGADGAPHDDLDRLWAIAIRWQVGDERVIGPIARRRLVALGAPALGRAMERLGSQDGLELECVQALLREFPRDAVVPRLLAATASSDVATRRTAVRFVGALAVEEAEARLVELLDDAAVRAYALRALAAIRRAPPAARALLHGERETDGVAAAVCLGAVGDDDAIAALVGALGPDVGYLVRVAAEQRLAAIGARAAPALAVAAASAPTLRARRCAVRALGASKAREAVDAVRTALADGEPWVRFDAVGAARTLLAALPADAVGDLRAALDAARAAETDPFVRRLR